MRAVVLVALADALSRTHTTQACTEALYATLREHFPLQALTVMIATHAPLAQGELSSGGKELTIRLSDLHGESGKVRLVFAARKSRDELPSESLLEDLEVVLSGYFRQMLSFERAGAVAHKAHQSRKVLDEQLRAKSLPSTVIAESPSMRRLYLAVLPAVARQSVTLLIQGETGTGKELVARRVHELSPRAKKAFVVVNCGAIPSELVESTLFGHERGAFTGAVRQQPGVFERAHGGTLFLDEIAELPLPAQVKLLRVLQERTFERVGGAQTLSADVRVIAATHRELHARVREGVFREDLYYRLNVFAVQLPALRERTSEIGSLARHILQAISLRMGVPAPTLSRQTLADLQKYHWPGNVRELQNVLERAMLVREGSGPLAIELPKSTHSTHRVRTFADASRKAIEDALAATDGKVYGPGGAAELLALKPTTLASKMKKLRVRSDPR